METVPFAYILSPHLLNVTLYRILLTFANFIFIISCQDKVSAPPPTATPILSLTDERACLAVVFDRSMLEHAEGQRKE